MRPTELVRLYWWPLRILTATLYLASTLGLPVILYWLLIWPEPPIPHARTSYQARLLLLYAFLPYVLARTLRWLCTATLEHEEGALRLTGRGLHIEVPAVAIERITPWRVPLPGTGFSLVLRGGTKLGYGIEPTDLQRTVETIASAASLSLPQHPALAYGIARQSVIWRWYHWWTRFVLFPAIPGILVFRLDQYLRFGGPFAEYYLYGLRPYLENLVLHLAAGWMNCVLWVGSWRVLTELLVFVCTWYAPHYSRQIRTAAEIAMSVLYYGGISAIILFVALR